MSDFTDSLTSALTQMRPSQDLTDLKTKLQTLAYFLSVEERDHLLRVLNLGDSILAAGMTAERAVDEAFNKLRDISAKEGTPNAGTPEFHAAIFDMQIAFAYQYPVNNSNDDGTYADSLTLEDFTPADALVICGKSRQLYLKTTLDQYFASSNAYQRRRDAATGQDRVYAKTPDGINLTEREVEYLHAKGVAVNVPTVTHLRVLNGLGLGGQRLDQPVQEFHIGGVQFNLPVPVGNATVATAYLLGLSVGLSVLTGILFIDMSWISLAIIAGGGIYNAYRHGTGAQSFYHILLGNTALILMGLIVAGLVVSPLASSLLTHTLISSATADMMTQATMLLIDTVIPLALLAKGIYNEYRGTGRTIVEQFTLLTQMYLQSNGLFFAGTVKGYQFARDYAVAAYEAVASACVAAYQAVSSLFSAPQPQVGLGSTARIAQEARVGLGVVEERQDVRPVVAVERQADNRVVDERVLEVERRFGMVR